MQIIKSDWLKENSGLFFLVVLIITVVLIYFALKDINSPETLERKKEMEQKRRKKSNELYSHIPVKYRELCYNDDDLVMKSSRTLGGLFVSDKNKAGKFAQNISKKSFQTRQSKYISIITDFKLDVNSKYRNAFVEEANILISKMDPYIPSSWISYATFIEWCLKFVERYPINLSETEEDTLDLDIKEIKENLNKEALSKRNNSKV